MELKGCTITPGLQWDPDPQPRSAVSGTRGQVTGNQDVEAMQRLCHLLGRWFVMRGLSPPCPVLSGQQEGGHQMPHLDHGPPGPQNQETKFYHVVLSKGTKAIVHLSVLPSFRGPSYVLQLMLTPWLMCSSCLSLLSAQCLSSRHRPY